MLICCRLLHISPQLTHIVIKLEKQIPSFQNIPSIKSFTHIIKAQNHMLSRLSLLFKVTFYFLYYFYLAFGDILLAELQDSPTEQQQTNMSTSRVFQVPTLLATFLHASTLCIDLWENSFIPSNVSFSFIHKNMLGLTPQILIHFIEPSIQMKTLFSLRISLWCFLGGFSL